MAEQPGSRTPHVGRWRLTLEYDGAPFVGWQVQPEGPSIQEALEAALARFAGVAVTVQGSGRTDAGVHARGQVCSFWLDVPRTPSAVRDGLNAALPLSVAVVEATPAPDAFDARSWVMRKRYRYLWLDRRARSPWWEPIAWHVRPQLDMEAMATAATSLCGPHDFSAFRASGCGAAGPHRTIEALRLHRPEPGVVAMDVVGNGFLRHMVRIIAGTLTDVGHGRKGVESVAQILHGRDRTRAGQTAPAHGLTLMEVEYGDRPSPWQKDAAISDEG